LARPLPYRPPMINLIIRTLLEPVCVSCHQALARPLAGPVCAACWAAVKRLTPPYCGRCGDALASWRVAQLLCPRCRRQPPLLDVARSAGQYEGALRRIVHAYKYDGRRTLAVPLARLMAASGEEVLRGADAVIPVPLHPWRSFRRGFNQADDLARRFDLPVWRVLCRRAHGPPQAGLPAARRHANVRRAFALRYRPPRRRLRDSTLVLIDDVMTTGATLRACAGILRRAGARSVRALTVARAVAGAPAPPPATHRLATGPRR